MAKLHRFVANVCWLLLTLLSCLLPVIVDGFAVRPLLPLCHKGWTGLHSNARPTAMFAIRNMTETTTSTKQDLSHPNDEEVVQSVKDFLAAQNPDALKDTNIEDTKQKFDEFHVATTGESIRNDPALRMMSSEIGVKQLNGEESDDTNVARAILFERTLDTVEDILTHIRRVPYDVGLTTMPPEVSEKRKTVVVLGSGWASHALMKVVDCCKVRLVVVSPTNHFVFTPMLASAAVGTVEYRSMTEAVRRANPMIDSYIEGKAIDVDVVKKKVKVQMNSLLENLKEGEPPILDLNYDHLVVSVGNQVSFYNTPGAESKCLRLKSCDDARQLRTALGECFEYASRPDVAGVDQKDERGKRVTFVVVGGGPTGVELSGEISDLAQDITRPRVGAYPRLADSIRVVLVHGGPELLPQFEEELRVEALRALEKRGVEVLLNNRVTEVRDGEVLLSAKLDTGEREQRVLPMGLAVWCAGIAPVPFVEKLLSQLPEEARGAGGRVNVDRWLRPPMPSPELRGSVMVLGDAASLQSRKKTLLPQTAQVAGQQGAYVARLLARGYDLNTEEPVLADASLVVTDRSPDPAMEAWLKFRNLDVAPGFSFLNLGLLAYLGGGQALSQVQIGDVPVFSYAGSVAFVLWRSVYLVKQVATRNRVLVIFDWLKSSLFGRDITRL